MHIVHLEHIQRSATAEAEQQRGLRANPYPDDSAAHEAWQEAYCDAEEACVRAASQAASMATLRTPPPFQPLSARYLPSAKANRHDADERPLPRFFYASSTQDAVL